MATLSFSQHGITQITNLKPLDRVIAGNDTLVLLDHDMLVRINEMIIKVGIQKQHIDSLGIIIVKQSNDIILCQELSTSLYDAIELYKEMHSILKQEYNKEKRRADKLFSKFIVTCGIVVTELIIIVLLLLL